MCLELEDKFAQFVKNNPHSKISISDDPNSETEVKTVNLLRPWGDETLNISFEDFDVDDFASLL